MSDFYSDVTGERDVPAGDIMTASSQLAEMDGGERKPATTYLLRNLYRHGNKMWGGEGGHFIRT